MRYSTHYDCGRWYVLRGAYLIASCATQADAHRFIGRDKQARERAACAARSTQPFAEVSASLH